MKTDLCDFPKCDCYVDGDCPKRKHRRPWKEFATYFVLAMLFGLTVACWLAAAIWGS